MPSPRFRHSMIQTCAVTAIALAWLSPCRAASNGRVIYDFSGGNDGGDPATQITFDSSGNAYGTTVVGGDYGCGTVFQLSPVGTNWELNTLYSFSCLADGKNPYGGVTLDAKGNLYGTTVAGGSGVCAGDGCGTVFELSKSGSNWTETVLYNFTGGNDGSGPGGGVVFDNDGNLYGTTPDGGRYSMGVVYELSPGQGGPWTQTVIHAFTGGADGGVGSLGSLLYNGGKFYGVAEIGGTFGLGTVFELSPASGGAWRFTTIHEFEGQPHAGSPYGGLIMDGHGGLLGTTYFGGVNGQGTVFDLALVNGKAQETTLYSFTGGNDGSFPTSTPVFDHAGNLYVTTSNGGNPDCDCGTIFELSRSKGEVKGSTVHSFRGFDGSYPNYGLTIDAQGNLYGTTPVGGTQNAGVAFSFTP